MKALLDTHTLLWMCSSADRLSDRAKVALLDDRNELFFSMAGWWEIAIKIGLGKLELQANWAQTMKREMRHNGIEWLPIRPEHCEQIPLLPFHHRDPFDRLLIAQAITEKLTIITCDQHFAAYDVRMLW